MCECVCVNYLDINVGQNGLSIIMIAKVNQSFRHLTEKSCQSTANCFVLLLLLLCDLPGRQVPKLLAELPPPIAPFFLVALGNRKCKCDIPLPQGCQHIADAAASKNSKIQKPQRCADIYVCVCVCVSAYRYSTAQIDFENNAFCARRRIKISAIIKIAHADIVFRCGALFRDLF